MAGFWWTSAEALNLRFPHISLKKGTVFQLHLNYPKLVEHPFHSTKDLPKSWISHEQWTQNPPYISRDWLVKRDPYINWFFAIPITRGSNSYGRDKIWVARTPLTATFELVHDLAPWELPAGKKTSPRLRGLDLKSTLKIPVDGIEKLKKSNSSMGKALDL